jgi:hypothetical protein
LVSIEDNLTCIYKSISAVKSNSFLLLWIFNLGVYLKFCEFFDSIFSSLLLKAGFIYYLDAQVLSQKLCIKVYLKKSLITQCIVFPVMLIMMALMVMFIMVVLMTMFIMVASMMMFLLMYISMILMVEISA